MPFASPQIFHITIFIAGIPTIPKWLVDGIGFTKHVDFLHQNVKFQPSLGLER